MASAAERLQPDAGSSFIELSACPMSCNMSARAPRSNWLRTLTRDTMFAQLVSEDPKIWVADDCVPQEFLDHVDAAFAAKDLGPRVVEKYDGRRILARNVDFEVDELSRGMFENIAKVLGITELDRCRDFMVSEVWADGQTSHVDHINLDDLAANKYNVDFLDLSKQSSSAGSPRRVVPTVSIVVYLNDVGGIRFPHAADEAGTIAAKCGRVVMFQNYDDVHRPAHKASAEHHGIYFKDMPKRILVMGLLANENPSMVGSNPPWQGLLYCAGTSRDPLFHDNPSYEPWKKALGRQTRLIPLPFLKLFKWVS